MIGGVCRFVRDIGVFFAFWKQNSILLVLFDYCLVSFTSVNLIARWLLPGASSPRFFVRRYFFYFNGCWKICNMNPSYEGRFQFRKCLQAMAKIRTINIFSSKNVVISNVIAGFQDLSFCIVLLYCCHKLLEKGVWSSFQRSLPTLFHS